MSPVLNLQMEIWSLSKKAENGYGNHPIVKEGQIRVQRKMAQFWLDYRKPVLKNEFAG